jgi:hypothetical protein
MEVNGGARAIVSVIRGAAIAHRRRIRRLKELLQLAQLLVPAGAHRSS